MMTCPYCCRDNAQEALVCATCSRDIAIPATLVAERDDLLRKRELIRDELHSAREALEMIRSRNGRRLP